MLNFKSQAPNLYLNISPLPKGERGRVRGYGIATYSPHLSAKGGSAFGGFLLPFGEKKAWEKFLYCLAYCIPDIVPCDLEFAIWNL
jgi:hypothetical protein